ncbi:serine phosphatase RsbU (regulator of sigma subunit)/DNA-binding response OmpR family regulator [Actinoplanes campanulatus]|uniref:Serine phosphatase RsbU (Regulator of sigma subunit)/DNA-binding response OmpR family regulator n=1 Tax=Actinoplanes campanulatus TaxID=113559 RepID=A0A7W5FK88_9ACTN|nr:serine phosphatase RsbU (regulator of sigma subunit)/DNA-binding response OmpR family regulator [Actinoplanes campanulatus]
MMVVDDDPVCRDFLRTLLGYRGHQTCEAADGGTALSLARRRPPDAVITDVMMPHIDGYELARRLRIQPATRHIPIAFSTAHYGRDEIEPMARACGVRDVIFKPAQPGMVLATIDALLGSGSVTEQAAGLAGSVDAAGAVSLGRQPVCPADDLTDHWRNLVTDCADRLAETHQLTRSGMWDLDPESGMIVLSTGLCDLLRLPSARVGLDQLRQRVHPDDLARLLTIAGKVWRTGEADRTEIRVAAMDGIVHELIVSCRATTPGRRAGEAPRTMRGVAQDVTQIRHAQRAGQQAQAQWDAERRAADTFHRAVLPRELPAAPGVELGAIYLAAPERLDIGTGWYDVQQVDGGRILLSVGEVAGHDQPAAAAIASILAALRAYAHEDPDPARLLTRLNRLLIASLPGDTFATAVVAIYDPETGLLCLANAGHPVPLLLLPGEAGDPAVVALRREDPALGVFPDAEFSGQHLPMAAGSVLCAYTDGLIDRHSGPQASDARRLPQVAVRALGDLEADRSWPLPDAQELAERIVREMLGGDSPDDDVCLAVLWVSE